MSRVALLASEPLRPRMAGIGIRYLEFARRLRHPDLELVLVAADGSQPEALGLGDCVDIRRFERGRLAAILGDCDGAVAQGHLANDLLIEMPELPTAIDLYDPWLVENLHYRSSLGLDPYRSDHATWVLQLGRGDFFLCSSQEQRRFYLGFLTAVGRVNPESVAADPDLRRLIAPVPFGIPDTLPPHRPFLDPAAPGERRLLFGGLYDWYDPWPVLEGLRATDREDWTLLLIRNPNPESTPQKRLDEVEGWCRRQGWWGTRVRALDWVPFERRYDLLRDVDVLLATHLPGLETELSLRTRFLDALAVGCPVLTTEGGTVSRLLREWGAGWVVPPAAPDAVAVAMQEILSDAPVVASRVRAGTEGVERFRWSTVLAPLLDFCVDPHRDDGKERFTQALATRAPADTVSFRLRRRLGLLLGLGKAV